MSRMVRLAVVGALLLGIALATSRPVVTAADVSGCGGPGALKPAAFNFTLKDLNGHDVSLTSLKGKVVILDFWATWCGPCKFEIPGFIDLYNRYKDKGLEVVGVALDDDTRAIKPYADKMKMNYRVLIGTGHDAIQEAYGPIFGIPTTIIITREGKICKRHVGMATKEAFEAEIKKLL